MKQYFAGLSRNSFLLAFASFFADTSTEMLYPVLPVFLTRTLKASGSIVGLVEGFAEGPGALDRSRVACDLERVEVLLELNGPAVADRPDVGDLCSAFLSLPVKSEVIVAESHNSLAAVTLKDLVRVKDEFIETHR